MYDHDEHKKESGDKTVTVTLNKVKLCHYICEERRDPADFVEFTAALDMIEDLVEPTVQEAEAPAGAENA
jgi:hypothetical protein